MPHRGQGKGICFYEATTMLILAFYLTSCINIQVCFKTCIILTRNAVQTGCEMLNSPQKTADCHTNGWENIQKRQRFHMLMNTLRLNLCPPCPYIRKSQFFTFDADVWHFQTQLHVIIYSKKLSKILTQFLTVDYHQMLHQG